MSKKHPYLTFSFFSDSILRLSQRAFFILCLATFATSLPAENINYENSEGLLCETTVLTNPPVIRVEGNNHPITNGNMIPEPYYHTDFSTPCSRTHTFEIRNYGYQSINLELTGTPLVDISGSSDFSVTKQPDLSSIPSNGIIKTNFDITFSPSSHGLKTATVSIANNDPDDDPFIFAIHGYLFEGSIIYVNDDATGANDGTSWDDALTSLEFALYLARNCNVEVWVAEGTYHGFFDMPKNVHVLGGFPNSGNPGLADRDWDTYKTILSGDINGDDGPDFSNMEENWGDFIRTFDVGMDFLLEGFYIEGGNGSNGVWYNGALAGSVPTIAHCTFQNNTGTFGGAAYGFVHQGSENMAIVKNCRFIHNRGTFGGVAQLFSYEGEIDWTFTNCSFQNNKGVIGANFSFLSDNVAELTTKFTNCTFQNDDEPFLYNGNQTQVSKAIHLLQNGTSTNTSTIDNCIFWRGTGTGKTLSNNSATVNISHTLMEENGCPGANCGDGMIFNQDPLFKDAANGDVSLDDCSPAIDAGLDPANLLVYDIEGNLRQFDAISGGMNIDMGAIENQTDQDSDDDGTPNCEDIEECDGLDNNGDGYVDEGLPTFDFYLDGDGDGYGAGAATNACSSPGNDYVLQNGDCNDSDPNIFPGAIEACNGIDDNCNGQIDDNVPSGQTYTGNVTFVSQADVDAWQDCYSVIDGHLTITGYYITDLSPLMAISEVTGSISIYYNGSLTTLNGLDNLATVGGSLTIFYNFLLSDCCAIHDLVNGGVTGTISIFFNAAGCNSVSDINSNCGGSNLGQNPANTGISALGELDFVIYPNPASSSFKVILPEEINEGKLVLMDLLGRNILVQAIFEGQTVYTFDIGNLANGVYMMSVNAPGQPVQAKKLVLE